MNNCKYLKQKLNRKLYCKKLKCDIKISNCSNCKYKEYNCTKYKDNCANKNNKNKLSTMIVQKSNNHQIPNKDINKDNKPIWVKKSSKLSNKSKRLAKLERNRTSILTDDLDHCYLCGKAKNDLHEIYPGRNRLNSIKYRLILPLCREHHIKMHNDLNMRLKYLKLGQKKFNEVYPELDFVEIFKRNYL